MIILDFGSGNTCKNSKRYITQMINKLVEVDSRKHDVVVKFQLFKDVPPNILLRHDVFRFAYEYAKEKGYQTTASVFDMDSLQFLLTYEIPFVKLANRPDLYWLAGEVPRKVKIVASSDGEYFPIHDHLLLCVSKYPATADDYESRFCLENELHGYDNYVVGISDHTTDFTLYHKYKPTIYECHYKLNDSTGPDAGPFSRTPEQLSEIL